jgi:hypothetical protein
METEEAGFAATSFSIPVISFSAMTALLCAKKKRKGR